MSPDGGRYTSRIAPGQVRGIWTVLEQLPRSREYYAVRWRCRCRAGKVHDVRGRELVRTPWHTCGCDFRVMASALQDSVELLKAARNVLPPMSATRQLLDQFLVNPEVIALTT